MKIGKFAEMHNITQDTVRHYLDLELLVAEKDGGHYKFSDSDSRDLKRIIELKNLGFSLSKAQQIMAMQRLSGENTKAFRDFYLSCLKEKKEEVEGEIANFTTVKYQIKERINEIKWREKDKVQKLGLSLSSLHLLQCPYCQSQLTLPDGTIEQNNVIEASINCSCGYSAEIKDGIYIDKSCVRTKLVNGERLPTKEEYLDSTTPNYSNFLYRGIATLVEYINKYEKELKYIVEIDNCVGFTLMQYIKYIPPESTYILIDYDYERITSLKKDLENFYQHKNFIFLCCDYNVLPLRKSSVDLVIDYHMTERYEKETGSKLYDVIVPLVKDKGTICGAYIYYEELKGEAEITESSLYNEEQMMELINGYNLNLLDSTILGPLTEGISYNKDLSDRLTFQGAYICKKI
ncbi:MAG: MerR family transcriptional regulator [Tissierellia bacterium]|nr:MerR family transcriptional regulator [Tissierellia bacterium]